MRPEPFNGQALVLRGEFEVDFQHPGYPRIQDAYELSIKIPVRFPKDLPRVEELGMRILRHPSSHVNGDDTLCLGSSLRLAINVGNNPTLLGFAQTCIEPYLYQSSYRETHNNVYISGELDHGPSGEIDDYKDLFGLKTDEQVLFALERLSEKKRIANKKPCPCGCGKRTGSCRFNERICGLRNCISRALSRKTMTGLKS